MPPDVTEPMSTPMSWESIQQRLGAQVWRALLVFIFVGAPVSALRATNTGWLPIYGFHLSILALVLVALMLGDRVPYRVKAALTVIILSTGGLGGMLGLGLLSQATTAFVACVVLTSLLFSSRATLFVAVAFVASISAIAIGFVSGRLRIAFDANLFVLQPLNWALPLLAALLVATTLALSISVYKNSTYALLVEVERQRDLLAHQATHDRLTDLPTLRLATDRLDVALKTAQRKQSKVALMFLDLDGFKKANDTYGHEAGDVVLQAIALRLLHTVRASDTVARIGGDEFIVVLSDIQDSSLAAETAKRIITAISEPIPYKDHQLCVGCSVGIAVYPEHATDAAALRRAADAAMYAVKRSGKNNFLFANVGMHSHSDVD